MAAEYRHKGNYGRADRNHGNGRKGSIAEPLLGKYSKVENEHRDFRKAKIPDIDVFANVNLECQKSDS